ncbi:MAG: PEP/pyruvate-binding domain-containing protein, partial [Candidatus Thermoplasmatota archaeon]|nr:PEP/pyruvate-binding domain-containing protein [Candidatus Thermoplasmatota archaeon]
TTHPNTHIEHSLRKPLVEALNTHKYQTHQGTINTYSRDHYGPHIRFSRIGSGALGGKARALAFMDKIFTTYFSPSPFKNIHLFIPRTIVLSTNIFDSFIQQNNLLDIITESLPDDRIASRFMERDLPSTILGDLRNFIKEVRTPLAIRSSSLLEDALFQPFAGVYSSMMLPNYSHDLESRYKDLCNAIKFVYASTFFQKAVNYLHNSPHTVMDEKMGVVIQEVVGHTHDTIFYPTISGVARSYNYYPVNPCKNEDGVAFLALGMGKTIVDGGITYRSCPARPNVPHYSSIDELLKYSQTTFYAIDLTAKTTISHQEEDKSMTQHPLKTAEAQQELTYLASTYSPNDQQLYSGLSDVGPRVLDFAPILKDTAFPLAKIINLLLKTCEIAIGTPVEIEFAVNIDYTKTPPIEFALLQVRSMVATDDIVKVDITKIPSEHILCSCKKALGNGIITDIHDIIQVKPEHFDLSKTTTIVPEIRTLNEKLAKEHHPYLLVGPGRWGSTDQCLGIPVVWSDISGAKTIVETPVEQRIITPSEGSHFFQNLSSLRIGYFTIQSNTTDDYFNYEKLDSYPTIEETDLLRHIHLIKPLEIRIDGRSRQGIIILSPQ